jgi:flavorubredoxin
VEVKDLAGYSKLSMYLKGAPRAMQGKRADIEPAVIDVSGYDAVVVGTPVWAGNPTPAVNAAVAALVGIEGKAAVVFCTSGGAPGKTLETMKAMLADRGADVRGEISLTTRDVEKPGGVGPLVDLVRSLAKEKIGQ